MSNKLEEQLDLLIKGRKALPIGTEKVWNGKKYRKGSMGWEYVSDNTDSQKEESKEETTGNPLSADNPREEASKQEDNSQYEYARESKVSNLGEDLKGSARHKRNQWRSLEEAEKDGSAENSVKRDTLLKANPPQFEIDSKNAASVLVLNEAIRLFPKSPDYGYGKRNNETPQETRKLYVEAYEQIKKTAESLQNLDDPTIAIQDLRSKIKSLIVDESGRRAKNNSIAQTLVPYFNNTLKGGYRASSRSALGKSNEFAKLAKEKNLTTEEKIEAIRSVVYENKSYKDAIGIEKGSKEKDFDAADLYVKHAERQGPEYKNLESEEGQKTELLKKMQMRGVQFGNSVTDEERVHHLKQTALAFKDLTDILGLPTEMASFNGKLGLAIGARGKGRALAHYEPSSMVINLTRKSGVGSLAHEWAHFFDNVVAKSNNLGKYTSQQANWDAKWDSKAEGKNPTLKAMTKLQHSSGMMAFKLRLAKQEFSSPKKEEYWTSPEEVWARTFEVYVDFKLKKQGRKNTYLSGVEPHKYWPTEEEMQGMEKEFDEVFVAFKSSEDLKKALDLVDSLIKGQEEPAFYASTVVISPDEAKILLAKRKDKEGYTSVGGGANFGETPRQTAVREAFEEANLILNESELLDLSVKHLDNGKVCHCFFVILKELPEALSVKNDPDKECNKWIWFPVDKPLPEPLSDNRRESILNVFRVLEERKAIKRQMETNALIEALKNTWNDALKIQKGGEGSGKKGHTTFKPRLPNKAKLKDLTDQIDALVQSRSQVTNKIKELEASNTPNSVEEIDALMFQRQLKATQISKLNSILHQTYSSDPKSTPNWEGRDTNTETKKLDKV
jgi:8-oxo-dGTP pyrophosphatase MutT (NUDIX family)